MTEDKVDALFKVEKLIISELLQKPGEEEEGLSASTLNISDLSLKFSQIESKDDKSISTERLEHLLCHLPFVIRPSPEEISLINSKSISTSKNGGAQCFLVVETGVALEDEKATEVSIETIIDFVKTSDYASKVKLLNSQDLEVQKATNQVRFLAEAHTFALAVQARIASDQKLGKLTKSYLEQAMSISAPIFDPVKAQQKLTSISKQLGYGNIANSNEDPELLASSDLMKKNIAEMYQYYNHLIFQQGGGMVQQPNLLSTGYNGAGPVPRLGDPDHFEKSSYTSMPYQQPNMNQDLGVVGFRQ